MSNVDPAGPVRGPDTPTQPEDIGPLARDFQDLLLADKGRQATVTVTPAHDGGAASRGPAGIATPVPITAVRDRHPDAAGPRRVTITAVSGGHDRHRDPDISVITAVHGDAHPDGPNVVTITAVSRRG